MSSSEDYLDSLLDSILGGGKSAEEEKPASVEGREDSVENRTADAGKAMSPDEIEEMLVSMGTLEGDENEPQKQEAEEPEQQGQESGVDEMEAMLAFMNEHNASVAEEGLTDSFSPDDPDMGEELPQLSPDDLPIEGLGLEEPGIDELGTDEFGIDEFGMDGTASDDFSNLNFEDLFPENAKLGEEGLSDEVSLDDLSLEEPEMEEDAPEGMADFDLTDFGLGEDFLQEESLPDGNVQESMSDFNLDELSLDDLELEEEELPEENAQEDMSGFHPGDFSLDDLSLEEPEPEPVPEQEPEPEAAGGDLMSMEEIDRLLGNDMSFEEEPGKEDEMAMEETVEGDDDLSALLADMDHDDDLSEIHDLLGQSEQSVPADEDMLAMLEGVGRDDDLGFDLFESDEAAKEAESIRELTPEEIEEREGSKEKGKKKRKKQRGKKRNKDDEEQTQDAEIGFEDLLGDVSAPESDKKAPKEKKPGFIARLMNLLLESDEEDEDPLAAEVLAGRGGATGNISGENRELLKELNEEDKKGKKKKKDKKAKKEAEKEKKPKKPKKAKPKKQKASDKEADLLAPPEKRLSKKKVISVFLFCGTIAACIILATSVLPDYLQEQGARLAYDQKEYRDVYDLLYGKKLKEEDEILFKRSELILQMDRKISSYENYVNLNMRLEALDALVSGVARYQLILADAEAYNVVSEVTDIYVQILGRLTSDFGISEADALDIISSEDDVVYSRRLKAVIDGTYSGAVQETSGERQDVLPEEEEMIERVDSLEEETTDGLPAEEMQDGQSGEGVESGQPEDVQEMLPEEEPAADENSDEGSEV